MRQCYISGQYSNADPMLRNGNIMRAMEAGIALLQRNWLPIVPHTSMNHSTLWSVAISRDKMVLHSLDPMTDVLVVLSGWGDSPGACEEVKVAQMLGIRVLTLHEAIRL
jgi:hypothetical protein